jgi:hypothetical protein
MQVLYRATNVTSDLRCSVCGQGFLVYWTPTTAEQRARWQRELLEVLRSHHTTSSAPNAHPAVGFNLPEWAASGRFPVAALADGPFLAA